MRNTVITLHLPSPPTPQDLNHTYSILTQCAPLTTEEDYRLRQQIRSQVEFYLSSENLSRDKFLTSILAQYNGNVPIQVIANFPKMRELYTSAYFRQFVPAHAAVPADEHVVMRAVAESHAVQVVQGQWLVPVLRNVVSPQSLPSSTDSPVRASVTVVVKQVPSDASELQVATHFTTERVAPTAVEHDESRTVWYLLFESTEAALEAMKVAKSNPMQGQTIHAALRDPWVQPPRQYQQQNVYWHNAPMPLERPPMMQGAYGLPMAHGIIAYPYVATTQAQPPPLPDKIFVPTVKQEAAPVVLPTETPRENLNGSLHTVNSKRRGKGRGGSQFNARNKNKFKNKNRNESPQDGLTSVEGTKKENSGDKQPLREEDFPALVTGTVAKENRGHTVTVNGTAYSKVVKESKGKQNNKTREMNGN